MILPKSLQAAIWKIVEEWDAHPPIENPEAAQVIIANILTRHLEAAMEGEGWQPIDTAKPNHTILLAGLQEDSKGNTLGWWRIEAGYYNVFRGWSFGEYGRITNGKPPTHWRPLPEPPDA